MYIVRDLTVTRWDLGNVPYSAYQSLICVKFSCFPYLWISLVAWFFWAPPSHKVSFTCASAQTVVLEMCMCKVYVQKWRPGWSLDWKLASRHFILFMLIPNQIQGMTKTMTGFAGCGWKSERRWYIYFSSLWIGFSLTSVKVTYGCWDRYHSRFGSDCFVFNCKVGQCSTSVASALHILFQTLCFSHT